MDKLEQLIADLSNEDDEIWIWAARDLGRLRDSGAVIPLCGMLFEFEKRRSAHNWPAKVIEAADALGKISDTRAEPFLSAALLKLKTMKALRENEWLDDWVLCVVDNAIRRCKGLEERYIPGDDYVSF